MFFVFFHDFENCFKVIIAIFKTIFYGFSWRFSHGIYVVVIKNFDKFLFIIDKFIFVFYNYRLKENFYLL